MEALKSPLYQEGIRDHDIVIRLTDESSGRVELQDIHYSTVMARLRDSSSDVTIHFIGARDVRDSALISSSTSSFAPAPAYILCKYQSLLESQVISYAAVFQTERKLITTSTTSHPLQSGVLFTRSSTLHLLHSLSLYLNIRPPCRPYSLRHESSHGVERRRSHGVASLCMEEDSKEELKEDDDAEVNAYLATLSPNEVQLLLIQVTTEYLNFIQ